MKTTLSKIWTPFSDRTYNTTLLVAGHLFFFIIAIYSLVYYQERMLHFDTANYVFNLIYSGDFYFRSGREITVVTQLLPLLALKTGASLKTILQLYSLSFILLYYLIFNIIVYGFKNTTAGIFLILALFLTLRYKFYAPVGEVVIGISAAGLLAGWLTKDRQHFSWLPAWADWLIGCLILILISITHPFVFLSTFIILGFVLIFFHRWKDLSFWGIVLFAIGGLVLEYFQISQDGYESDRANPLFNAVDILSGFTELYVWERLLWFFDTEYALPFGVFLLALILMAWHKKWLSAAFLLLSFLALIAILLVTYAYLNTEVYLMIDGYLTHIGLVLALPLSFFLLRSKRPVWVFMACVLMIFSLDRICNKRKFYQQRQAYLMEIIEKNTTEDERKLLAHMKDFNWEKMWMPWAVAIETLMMSSLDSPDQAATIYIHWWNKKSFYLKDPDLFLGVHYAPLSFEPEEFPSELFDLKTGTYKEIKLPN